jgi:hypothetical protein
MPTLRVLVAIRTGWFSHLSATRLAVIPATCLTQHHSPPQIARELAQLLAQGHRLIEVGQEITHKIPSCHVASLSFVLDEHSYNHL